MFTTLLALALAADPAPAPLFVAHGTATTDKAGTLAKLSADFAVTLSDPDGTVPAGELISLRQQAPCSCAARQQRYPFINDLLMRFE